VRGHLIWVVVLGFCLASACGGSGTTSGTTGGATTTTGGSTTGTSGTSSTGGTTTGGGGRAPGADCSNNSQCTSNICGVNGSGKCCSTLCATSATVCTASGCDGAGACIYPRGVSCGADFCNGGSLTMSACNGAGTCLAGASAPCPNHFQCMNGTACNTQCGVATDCQSGYYCAASQCVPKLAVGPCTNNSICISGFCDIAGSGNCCTAQCMPTTDPACDATSCDVASGACVYPAMKACGAMSCAGSMLTAGACDATGACVPTPSPCPNNLVCNNAGTACLATCSTTANCVTGFYCSGGSCLAQQATGPCTTNQACTTGICGVSGTGHCCTAACSTTDATCGATDCDGTGACAYPSNTTACGSPGSCSGTPPTQISATTCDGGGYCLPPAKKDCTPFICGRVSCLASCSDNSSCVSGAFCDKFNNSCCAGLSSSGALSVDGMTGSDSACCGIGTNGACQTLTQAMKLIDSKQATNVTITATVDGGRGDWAPAAETYPIALGWGVELSAPGVFFLDSTAGNAIFDIKSYSSADPGYASIVGTAAKLVGVGMNTANTLQTNAAAAIEVENGSTLYIANANVNSSATSNSSVESLLVNAGATLVLGQDQSAGVTGTVTIGNALGKHATNGLRGIVCKSDGVSLGCTVKDATLAGQSSVVIQGQEVVDIDAEDFASISLTSKPVIGVPPSKPGFGNCPSKTDATQSAGGTQSVLVNGLATATLKNGTVQCIGAPAFQLQASTKGTPTVTIDNTVIQNTDLGIYASAGTATVTNSTVNFNFIGIWQDTDGTHNGKIDLSGGGNAVICSNKSENSQGTADAGIDVFNTSKKNLNASSVAWDTTGPDYFKCDAALASCSCNLASCNTAAGGNDMDAVEVGDAGITTTGNTQSPIAVDAGCN
jgi:hypothetical protein